jgi:hypothetical protein
MDNDIQIEFGQLYKTKNKSRTNKVFHTQLETVSTRTIFKIKQPTPLY